MSYPKPPWENLPGLDPNLVSQVTGIINQGVADAVTAGEAVAEQAIPAVVAGAGNLAEQVGSVVPTTGPIQGTTGSNAPDGGIVANTITGVIEAAAQSAIQEAQASIAKRAQDAITQALSGLGAPEVAVIPHGELKKIDAWERAGRTFVIGLTLTVLAGLVQVIGTAVSAGNVNFFTTDGWNSVITLAVGSVASSIFSYILRYLKEPAGAALDSSKKE